MPPVPDDPAAEPAWAERRPDGWLLHLRVQPGARRSRIVGPHGDALKVAVAAPADQGKANVELARMLAEALGVSVREVELLRGVHSRTKAVLVPRGADLDALTRS